MEDRFSRCRQIMTKSSPDIRSAHLPEPRRKIARRRHPPPPRLLRYGHRPCSFAPRFSPNLPYPHQPHSASSPPLIHSLVTRLFFTTTACPTVLSRPSPIFNTAAGENETSSRRSLFSTSSSGAAGSNDGSHFWLGRSRTCECRSPRNGSLQ